MTNLRLWREMLALCWRRRPLVTSLVLAFHLLTTVAFAGAAFGLKALVDASDGGPTAVIAIAAIGAALALAVDRYVSEAATIMTVHLVDRIGLTAVEPEIIRMCTTIEELDHLERSDYLDRVTAVRGQGWAIVESAWFSLLAVFVVIRLGLLLFLLAGADPWLLLLLVVFAVTQLWLDRRGKQRMADTHTATSEDVRLQRRLFVILTDPSFNKEVRVAGAGDELITRQKAAWARVIHARARARLVAALWSVAGWTVFAVGYTLALWLMLNRGGTAGSVVLVVTAGAQLRTVVEVGLGHSAQAVESSRVIQPYLWLREQYAASKARRGPGRTAPERLNEGIAIEGLTFTYPGASQPAVENLSIVLPAGSVVAVVGEYGSGKTTLVKILSKFYEPTAGSVRVDGVDLAEISSTSWWASMSAAFQDFGRYQTTVADAVGLGDLAAGRKAVHRALVAADADGVVGRLPQGEDTELGSSSGGVELSEGQWQRIALARACMRTAPILFVLDEPTASLDAPSEHAILQRYIVRSREITVNGGVTVIVSHRFSTVADADLILVMEKGHLIEAGVHADLVARNGTYAEFYNIQASAYAA